jgi:hypothetical protein
MDTHIALRGNTCQRWAEVSLSAKHNVTTAVSHVNHIYLLNCDPLLQALAAYPYLHRFKNNWAAEEIMRRTLRNSRDTRANKQGRRKGGTNTGTGKQLVLENVWKCY